MNDDRRIEMSDPPIRVSRPDGASDPKTGEPSPGRRPNAAERDLPRRGGRRIAWLVAAWAAGGALVGVALALVVRFVGGVILGIDGVLEGALVLAVFGVGFGVIAGTIGGLVLLAGEDGRADSRAEMARRRSRGAP